MKKHLDTSPLSGSISVLRHALKEVVRQGATGKLEVVLIDALDDTENLESEVAELEDEVVKWRNSFVARMED